VRDVPPIDAGDVLRQAIGEADWTPERHLRSLAECSLAALKRGKPELAWLLADRLVRIGNGQSPLPFVLRASALSKQGEVAEARADIETAQGIDPDDRFANEALTLFGAPEARHRGARHLLQAGDEPGLALALKTLARDGFASVIRAACADGMLRAQVFWRTATPLVARLGDGVGGEVIHTLPGEPNAHESFGRMADIAVPWPLDWPAVALSCDHEPCFVAPLVLRRSPGPRVQPLPSPAASFEPSAERPEKLLVVVPVYDDRGATSACLDSLRSAVPRNPPTRIIVIDDASPDEAIGAMLAERVAAGDLTLLRNDLNLGFAASVNRALALRQPCEDVLLLNADTIVPDGAIERLAAAAYADPAIATVTPLSNNGEDTSFPLRFAANPMPSTTEIALLDRLAADINAGCFVDMPNGVGFCLYVKALAVGALGPLSLTFGRGYYEDVEYCLRATLLGFRNVCATDVFVGHSGSRSFKAEKRALVRSNLPLLAERFPDYRAASMNFFRSDPLRIPVGRLEEALVRRGQSIRLVLMPRQLPDWLARHLCADAAGGSAQRIVFARVQEDDETIAVDLCALDEGCPQNVAWTFDKAGATLVDALTARLASWPIGSILVIDAFDLPRAVVSACRTMKPDLAMAIAASDASSTDLRRSTSSHRTFHVSTHAIAERVRSLTKRRAIVQAGEAGAVPPGTHPGRVAILAEASSAEDWTLARTVAERLKHASARIEVAFLGHPESGEPVRREHGIFVSGPLRRDDSVKWLTRIGGAACFIATRRYGLSDPRAEIWPQRGIPVASFDPRVAKPVRRGLALSLPPAASNDAVAEALAHWLPALGGAGGPAAS